jgi:hypothetical protein
VTITGTGLAGAYYVSFGVRPATGFTVNSATSITATAPAGSGTVDIQVTTRGGTTATSAADQFTYVVAPAVTAVSPNSGPTAGGTTVTITGTGLVGATDVTFGTTPATGFTINSATSITATVPSGTGTADIHVTTAGGASATSGGDQFSYVVAPTVTAVSPNNGPTAGGTTVTITGTGLVGATEVTFGTTAATDFTIHGATSITATAPAGTGTVDVHVSTTGGTSAASGGDQFTYTVVPAVTSVSPNAGPTSGGTPVTITGTGLAGATGVTFGTTPAASFRVNDATSIDATAPAGTGTVDVHVTTLGGTSAANGGDQFTYAAAPTVTAVSPNAGPTEGGTTVTITGTGLAGAYYVSFGVRPATGFTINSATSITATAPAGDDGTVDIRVNATGGPSEISAADQYTYSSAPTITLTPATLPDVPAGAAYSQALTADGGTAPYSYAVTDGTLPAGLTLSSDGTLAGTPATPGSYDFTVTATDAEAAPGPYSGDQHYTLVVGAPVTRMTRTWVSGDGDDANICTRDFPCQTFAAALAQTADGGEVNCLTPGGYGTLTIAQSVSIVCDHGTAGVIASGTDGIVINGPPGTAVVLSGFDLEGLGAGDAPAGINGIHVLGGSSLTLRNTRIRGFRGGYGIAFQPSAAATLFIDNVTISGNGDGATLATGGILVQPGASATARVTMVNSRVQDNLQVGIRLDTAGNSNAVVTATLDRLTITGNAAVGLLGKAIAGTGSIDVSVNGSTLAGNGTGIAVNGSLAARVSRTTISGNNTGLATAGGATIASFGDNVLIGNGTDGSFTGTLPRH